MIETQDLSVYYGAKRGVHGLNLSVNQGEIYGFLGPNGAGKTTTLRVLLDIIHPTAGKAAIFGLDCQKEGLKVRRRVGYIPGELNLYPKVRAADYFAMINAVRGNHCDPDYLGSLCERLHLDAQFPMRTYSRGNKQKVGLVAAMMDKPDLLILDEPTSGLDPLIQQAVLELVREARDTGRSVFFSSHVLSEVQNVCDRVGIIRDGVLVASEPVDKLIRRQFHRFQLRFERMPSPGIFEALGATETHRTKQVLTLEIQENLNAILSLAVTYGILELQDHPLSLEEIFLAYYGKNGDPPS